MLTESSKARNTVEHDRVHGGSNIYLVCVVCSKTDTCSKHTATVY